MLKQNSDGGVKFMKLYQTDLSSRVLSPLFLSYNLWTFHALILLFDLCVVI